jgi:hypothetical protein
MKRIEEEERGGGRGGGERGRGREEERGRGERRGDRGDRGEKGRGERGEEEEKRGEEEDGLTNSQQVGTGEIFPIKETFLLDLPRGGLLTLTLRVIGTRCNLGNFYLIQYILPPSPSFPLSRSLSLIPSPSFPLTSPNNLLFREEGQYKNIMKEIMQKL